MPSLLQVRAERMRRSFSLFVKNAWKEIDPAPLVWGWHLDAMCDCLEAVAKGEVQDLLINIPPGHAKSMIASVLWPAWRWTRTPSWQLLGASYEVGLATRDAVKSRELMATKWFRDHFCTGPSAWAYKEDQDLKQFYANTKGGHRQSLGVGGKATGYRGDCLLVDDSLKAEDAYSEVKRLEAKRWFSETMESRFNDQKKRERVMICQRLHEDDPPAHLLKQGGWQHLNLPSEFDPENKSIVRRKDGTIVWDDPRTKAGDPLFPAKFPTEVLQKLKQAMGSYAYAAQFLQRATPAAGGVIQRAWLNYRWQFPGQFPIAGVTCKPVPLQFDTIEMFTDAAFKKTEVSDFVFVGVFGKKGPDVYLLDCKWARMGFTETLQAIRDLKGKWRTVSTICVEDKANGSAIIELLKQEMPGVLPIEPTGSKEARIHAASKFMESGNFWLPAEATWFGPDGQTKTVGEFVEEACSFPNAKHDDAIDGTAQALNRMLTNSELGWLERLVSA
jgi:predicted phage terminase large subunit-like protein